MIHLTLNQISAYLDTELPEASVELVRLHLSSCLECTERFGHIEEQESALARLLVNEPGDLFFDGFAERALGPVPVKKVEPAPTPQATSPPKSQPTSPPTPSASPPAAATPPKARPARESGPKTPVATAPKRKGGASRVLLLAAALLVVGSAVAVLATRPRATTPSGARPRTESTGLTRHAAPSGASSPSATSPEPSGASPRAGGSDLLEAAAARSAEADRAGTAEAHDAAAAAWEQAIPELQDDADELAAGRREIAAARYAAWTEEATPERREAAMHAVRAYLLCAPAGAERDRAWGWLATLKR